MLKTSSSLLTYPGLWIPQQITKKAQQRLYFLGGLRKNNLVPKAACDLLRLLHRECTDILYHSVVQELHRSREKASEDHEHSSEVPAGLVYLQLPQRISRILVLTCLTCCPLPGTSSPSNQGQTDSEIVSSAIATLNLNMQTLHRHYHLLFLQGFLSHVISHRTAKLAQWAYLKDL